MKKIYIYIIKILSFIYRICNPSNITYIMSFNENKEIIIQLSRLASLKQKNFFVFYRPNCKKFISSFNNYDINFIEFRDNLRFLFIDLKKIMNSQLLFCDNYFAFLGGCLFNHKKTRVIQLWHANGAIKKFGWESIQTRLRSTSDKKRFQKVYNQFDDYPVGSHKMGDIFHKSYHVPFSRMNFIGYPRTDQYLNNNYQKKLRSKIIKKYPVLKNNEIILYAPTYREFNGNVAFKFPMDFFKILNQLNNNQKIIIKLHPHLYRFTYSLKNKITNDHIVWINDFSTNDLLSITDRLITDYSSIIFDYTLLSNAKEIIFYCYDFDYYKDFIGIQDDFVTWAPGKIVKNISDLIRILNMPLLKSDFNDFNKMWNTFNDGYAIKRLLEKEKQFL